MFLGQAERHFCPLPQAWYPEDSPCSAKHNPTGTWTVDVEKEERKWWEYEEQQRKEKEGATTFADLMGTAKFGFYIIMGAAALGIAWNLMSGPRPQFRMART